MIRVKAYDSWQFLFHFLSINSSCTHFFRWFHFLSKSTTNSLSLSFYNFHFFNPGLIFSFLSGSPVTVTLTETETETCSVVTEMTGNGVFVSDFVEQEETSIMESSKKESSWTNEKHSLYLKSIEASFVDQLYNSSDAISAWKNRPNPCIPSGQFKVLQGGYWSKKNFRREHLQPKDADRLHVSRGNPWINHFTNGSRHTDRPRVYPVHESQLLQETSCSNTEVSDQNFDEDTPTEKQDSRKRMRTSIIVHSSKDQVVPFRTSVANKSADTASPKQ